MVKFLWGNSSFNFTCFIIFYSYIIKHRFPTAKAPSMSLFSKLFGESISIAILTFGLNISFSKLFAKKYKYKISPNQEFFAYGISNIASSFFNGYPGCVGISRCFIGDGIGVKTQIVALINTIIMLIVILAIGPLLSSLPNVTRFSLLIKYCLLLVFMLSYVLPIVRISFFDYCSIDSKSTSCN